MTRYDRFISHPLWPWVRDRMMKHCKKETRLFVDRQMQHHNPHLHDPNLVELIFSYTQEPREISRTSRRKNRSNLAMIQYPNGYSGSETHLIKYMGEYVHAKYVVKTYREGLKQALNGLEAEQFLPPRKRVRRQL